MYTSVVKFDVWCFIAMKYTLLYTLIGFNPTSLSRYKKLCVYKRSKEKVKLMLYCVLLDKFVWTKTLCILKKLVMWIEKNHKPEGFRSIQFVLNKDIYRNVDY